MMKAQGVTERATLLVIALLSERSDPTSEPDMTLTDVAGVLDAARADVRARLHDRLRKIEAETGQIKMFLDEGTKQSASDRMAEDQAVLDIVRRGREMTAVELGAESDMGARISAILARLAKRDLVQSSGKGPRAVWALGTAHPDYVTTAQPAISTDGPADPVASAEPVPPPPAKRKGASPPVRTPRAEDDW